MAMLILVRGAVADADATDMDLAACAVEGETSITSKVIEAKPI
jgi:hypothetical protein